MGRMVGALARLDPLNATTTLELASAPSEDRHYPACRVAAAGCRSPVFRAAQTRRREVRIVAALVQRSTVQRCPWPFELSPRGFTRSGT